MNLPTIVTRRTAMFGAALAAGAMVASGAEAATAAEIDANVQDTLQELFAQQPGARQLYDRAAGVLVVPEIIKATLFVGGAYGEGAMLINGATDGYWEYAAASFGFQFGAQKTSQVLFFMTSKALNEFRSRDNIDIGADAEVTLIDDGAAFGVDNIEATAPIIGIVFSRVGLLGGASLQGGGYKRIIR